MNIAQVEYVLEVAKHKNFSRAAESLFITQPALSLQILNLEKELQVKLFQRMPQGVLLTPDGIAFCRDAVVLMADWRQLLQNMETRRCGIVNHLRIGIGPRAFSNGMFEKIVSFFDAHQETSVTFITDIRENMMEALADNRMDIAVDRLPPAQMLQNPERFSSFELTRERQCILLSPSDPRSSVSEISFQDLRDCHIISGPEGSMDDQIIRQNCTDYGITVSQVYRSDSMETVMNLIRSGKGAALGPRSFSSYYHVAAVPMVPEIYISLNFICLKRREDTPEFTLLREYLQSAFP